MLLVFTALIFATVGGTVLGVLAARKPGGFTSFNGDPVVSGWLCSAYFSGLV